MWTLLLTCLCSIFWWNGGRGQTLVSFASVSKNRRCLPQMLASISCQAVSHPTFCGR